ncbi:dipeptide/oligopeptide/nickel ABC transporter permease/ATP-binding protein [Microtetraspora malaysiensis]|uniref:dipeptide/oligopeptide/nickel ABC transporter permease/ATP-binding protein n=1 Tax=Microtetraspora malaysiensis TaxID=161358 RepID=UPI003D933FAC
MRNKYLHALVRTLSGAVGALTILLIIALAVVGPYLWHDAAQAENVADLNLGVSPDHLFGTDGLGRDVFARTMVATRLSLLLAVGAAVVGAILGYVAGIVIAVLPAQLRRVCMAAVDVSLSFPVILLSIVFVAMFGGGTTSTIVAIGIAFAPPLARLSSNLALAESRKEYFRIARTLGVPTRTLLSRYLLANIAEPLLLTFFYAIGSALVAVSALSFLGIGVQPPSYDWGVLLVNGFTLLYVQPAAALGPAAMIVIAGIGLALVGEALARAVNPRLTGARRRTAGDDAQHAKAAAEPAPVDPAPDDLVLDVRGLRVAFDTPAGEVVPVHGIDLRIRKGEVLGLVGESGSGKSMTALAVAGLTPANARVTTERYRFLGHGLTPADLGSRRIGQRLAMVFQDPATSLNPAMRLGTQMTEAVRAGGVGRREAVERAVERLTDVRIPAPASRLRDFANQLSGGQRQRVMIAMGLMTEPALIVADEPTTALDVTVQAQVLSVLRDVNVQSGASVLLISHDMSVIAQMCGKVAVMYAGAIVEYGDTADVVHRPQHPYTRALLASVITLDHSADSEAPAEPRGVAQSADGRNRPGGCGYLARCPIASERCAEETPPLMQGATSEVACWNVADKEQLV